MPVRKIERELDVLAELRSCASPDVVEGALHKALSDKVNVIVAKAADVAGDLGLATLVPDLCAAFERALIDPLKTDPKCWAKEAIAKALRKLGHEESAIFLKGVEHVQWEPVWDGEVDTAAGVRATCTLALLDCSDQIVKTSYGTLCAC